jgi:UDP-N-acetylmuramoyl-tripeptide--D-alanyl-D-alanine ligase
MVYPILAAVAVALEQGVSLDEVVPRLETLAPTPGRLQPIEHESGAVLIRDDAKSTLETIDAALDLLAQIPAARRIVVLGDVSEPPGSMGPIYRRLGERIAGIATRAIFVAEGSQRYASGARRAGMPGPALLDAGRSVARAVELVEEDLGPGDVVLIKGRDNQRLERISLALEGRTVRCELRVCPLKGVSCDRCPMLERGWDGVRPPAGG